VPEYGVLLLKIRDGSEAAPPERLVISGTQAPCTASEVTGMPLMGVYTANTSRRSAVAGIGADEYRSTHASYAALTFRLPGHTVVIPAGASVQGSRHSVALLSAKHMMRPNTASGPDPALPL
jgi:hypothetical protein